MGFMATQIICDWIVCLIICSGADQRKYQSSASLAFVRGLHRCTVAASNAENVSIWCHHHVLMPAIWRHWSGSTLAQAIAWCLTTPRHYLKQCWLLISELRIRQNARNTFEAILENGSFAWDIEDIISNFSSQPDYMTAGHFTLNVLKQTQNGRHFAGDILKFISCLRIVIFFIQIPMHFYDVPN